MLTGTLFNWILVHFSIGIYRRKVFVQSGAFEKALTKLEENKVLIISGNPGIGKTTLAHMLVNYLVFEHGSQIDFVYCKSLDEIDRSFKPNRLQVFLWDDFWGQKFDEIPGSPNYFNYFTKVIKDFTDGKQHYLIITSREYIIRKISTGQGRDLNLMIDLNKFMLNADVYTDEERLRILLNHIYFSGFEKEFFYNLEYSEEQLEDIITHPNYTPRHIDYFIRYRYTDELREINKHDKYTFLRDFGKYLENPKEFWAEVFEKQSPTAQLILIILLISSDPMYIKDLSASFLAYQEQARKVLNLAIEPLLFEQELFRLEELFIRTEEFYYPGIFVHFQSPGIKDFLLEYLRDRINAWSQVLIPGAIFFNQLTFVFTVTADETDLDDNDAEMPLFGKKILLGQLAKEQLKIKVLKDFEKLKYSVDEGREFTWELDRHDGPEDVKYWNLSQLCRWFPVNQSENEDVKQFVIKQVTEDIEKYDSGNTTAGIVPERAMEGFLVVISLCKDFMKFDEKKLISAYYSSISSTSNFLTFLRLKDIFPGTYKVFVADNLTKIRLAVRKQILDDIDEFLYDDREIELDVLIEIEIDDIFSAFGMKMTRKFEQEMEAASEWTISFGKKKIGKKKVKKQVKKKEKYQPPKFAAVVSEYANTEEEFDARAFIKECYRDDKDCLKKLLSIQQSKDHLLQYYFENAQSIVLLHQHLPMVLPEDHTSLNSSILNHVITTISKVMRLERRDDLFIFFNKLAAEVYFEDTKTITLKKIQDRFRKIVHSDLADIKALEPLLIKRGNWYEFLNTGVLYSFFTLHVMEMNDQKYIEEIENLIGMESSNGEHVVISLIDLHDLDRFKNVFSIPVLERFINSVKADTKKDIVSNYIAFFRYKYEFYWDKKKKILNDPDCNCHEIATDFILKYLFKGINITEPDLFFCRDYFWKDNIEKFGMRKEFLDKLYKQVIKCPYERRRTIIRIEPYDCLIVDLNEFIAEDDNYKAIEDIGLVDYMFNTFNAIVTAYDQYKAE